MHTQPTLVRSIAHRIEETARRLVGSPARNTPMKFTAPFMVALVALLATLLSACGPDREIGFQGRLTNASGNPINGSKTITFKLFDSSTGGTPVFTETKTVNVTNGLFDVALGSSVANNQYGLDGIDPEVFAQPLFLQIEIDGQTLSPRQKLLGASYAMTLAGGAVVGSSHEGDGAAGSDTTNINYGTFTVVAGGGGTALVLGTLNETSPGDLIRACSGLITAARNCPDPEFRVTANGNVRADGTFASPAADFAELMAARPGTGPGDVLAMGPDGLLARSTEAYQRTVVGVYATQPGFLANGDYADSESHIPVAMMGIVPVKVSMTQGPIRPGDLLVASPVPGRAMRAGANPPQGTVIGKALEAANRTGVIRMLVMLQ